MCHFWANPLSLLLLDDVKRMEGMLQPEHIEGIRSLPSFRAHVEAAVEDRELSHTLSLLESDEYLIQQVVEKMAARRDNELLLLRSLQLVLASKLSPKSFTDLY